MAINTARATTRAFARSVGISAQATTSNGFAVGGQPMPRLILRQLILNSEIHAVTAKPCTFQNVSFSFVGFRYAPLVMLGPGNAACSQKQCSVLCSDKNVQTGDGSVRRPKVSRYQCRKREDTSLPYSTRTPISFHRERTICAKCTATFKNETKTLLTHSTLGRLPLGPSSNCSNMPQSKKKTDNADRAEEGRGR